MPDGRLVHANELKRSRAVHITPGPADSHVVEAPFLLPSGMRVGWRR